MKRILQINHVGAYFLHSSREDKKHLQSSFSKTEYCIVEEHEAEELAKKFVLAKKSEMEKYKYFDKGRLTHDYWEKDWNNPNPQFDVVFNVMNDDTTEKEQNFFESFTIYILTPIPTPIFE